MNAAMTTWKQLYGNAPDFFFGQTAKKAGGHARALLSDARATMACFAILSCSVMASMFLWSHSTAR